MGLTLVGRIEPGQTVTYHGTVAYPDGKRFQRRMHCLSTQLLVSLRLWQTREADAVAKVIIGEQAILIPKNGIVFIGLSPNCDIFINRQSERAPYLSIEPVRLTGYFDHEARASDGSYGVWRSGSGMTLRIRAGSKRDSSRVSIVVVEEYRKPEAHDDSVKSGPPCMVEFSRGDSIDLVYDAPIILLEDTREEVVRMQLKLFSNEALSAAGHPQWGYETLRGILQAGQVSETKRLAGRGKGIGKII